MTASSSPQKNGPVAACGYAITTSCKGETPVSLQSPLPCIIILVHGVNDVGEAYAAQETGLCRGLNARLDRSHELGPDPKPDLTPSNYAMPPATLADKQKEGVKSDPDAVYFRRTAERKSWSPVVPFYWGSSENAGTDPVTKKPYIKKDNWHGQWTDRYGNRLDKNGAKNGGPFANATTNLNAMWGDGFNGEVANSDFIAEWESDPLHNLKKACPRLYMLLAAKRLAMLIKIIRNNESYKNVAINLLCHSQGSMVALTAHAILAAEGGKYSADTLILQDPPYSFEETNAEFFDGMTGENQQTTQSRIKTLSNIVHYIHEKKSSAPSLADLEFPSRTGKGVAGPNWKSGAGAKQWVNGNSHTFRERDNRGKVYLYFCPRDATVALMNVQGIGWQGVPDQIRALANKYAQQPQVGFAGSIRSYLPNQHTTLAVLSTLGEGFRQRIFTSREVNNQALLVGAPPGPYEMRSASGVWLFSEENSPTGNVEMKTKQIERGAIRQITGEELHPRVRAVLTIGEAGHEGKLAVSPIDAAIAIGAGRKAFATSMIGSGDFRTGERHGALPLTADETRTLEDRLPGQRKGLAENNGDDRLRVVGVEINEGILMCVYTTETPNEARARWQNQKTDKNSYHSAIPGNPAHAAGVTAYDLSLGAPLPTSENDKFYMDYLRAVADWRTDWESIKKAKDDSAKIMECYAREKTTDAVRLIDNTFAYYSSGVLPSNIARDNVAVLARPKLIVSQTVAERKNGQSLD